MRNQIKMEFMQESIKKLREDRAKLLKTINILKNNIDIGGIIKICNRGDKE